MRTYINNNWEFTKEFTENTTMWPCETVRIPHTVCTTPFNYFDESIYQMVSGYKKNVNFGVIKEHQHVLLTFLAIAHHATVWVNGKLCGTHACGYTAFTIDITPCIKSGEENEIVVRVDSRENINQPPFGNVIDYMTYGGIYRDVYYEIKEDIYIEDVFVYTPTLNQIKGEVTFNQLYEGKMHIELHTKDGKEELGSVEVHGEKASFCFKKDDLQIWDIDSPNLYTLEVTIEKDTKETRFGVRTVEFKAEGFFLNGKKLKIRGLNRHQSYPYVGYAMPSSMQKEDARILKEELGCNAVRTSHYPQSHDFIDACDEMGLLVFTEIPGWQHIGDASWQEKAIENTKEMVLQYRNHPSIMLWGVRINESSDLHDFYEATNQMAHSLDPSRQTSGVRFIKNSELLEDVYAYNDFVHEGDNEATTPKNKVTSHKEKAYFISEYNGHMYPTKAFDDEKHRTEHALRHARVLNSAAKDAEIAGSFGWCMFDYNTHRDFGSGDRVCYHGVLDMYRNMKQAGYIYAIQNSKKPILELSSSMDIGEYPGGVLGNIYLYTNADSVKMYKNGEYITEYTKSEFPNLAHGPILVNDFIGNQLVEKEGYSPKVSEGIKQIIFDSMTHGMNHLPKTTMLTAAKLVAFHGLKVDDGIRLYNKYISGWGDSMKEYRFDALKEGKVVASVKKNANAYVHLDIKVSHTTLHEGNTYDVASVRIVAKDENGNTLPYYNESIEFATSGAIELIGPSISTLRGGMGGTYVRSVKEGQGMLTIKEGNGKVHEIIFTIS